MLKIVVKFYTRAELSSVWDLYCIKNVYNCITQRQWKRQAEEEQCPKSIKMADEILKKQNKKYKKRKHIINDLN